MAAVCVSGTASGATAATCPVLSTAQLVKVIGSPQVVRGKGAGSPLVRVFKRKTLMTCSFVINPNRAYVTIDLITPAEARETVAVLREAIRTRPVEFRPQLVSIKGLGDQAWRQTSKSDVYGDPDNVRFIVRKGSRAFQIYFDDSRGEQGITPAKIRALAELVTARL